MTEMEKEELWIRRLMHALTSTSNYLEFRREMIRMLQAQLDQLKADAKDDQLQAKG